MIVKKRQRRLSDVDAVAISPYAKGLTTGDISAHFAEVYGATISKDTISRITDGPHGPRDIRIPPGALVETATNRP